MCFKIFGPQGFLDDLNAAFARWLDLYHQRVHSSTGQSPFERFTSRMECLRAAPSNLRDHFRKTLRRRVNKDRSVVVERRLFEAPVELIGKQVEIRCGQTSWGFHRPVDLTVNSRVKRTRNGSLSVCSDPTSDPTPCEGGSLWEVP